jgi:hypothetical protein
LRRRGCQAVVVCSTPFVTLARSQARAHDVADLPLAVIDHPLGGTRADVVAARAEQAASQVLAVLRQVLAP